MKIKVVWLTQADSQMEQIFKYIRKDSLDNARKVKKDILSAVALLESYPDRYPLDKEKIDNDGSFRCLILHKNRVSYRITSSAVGYPTHTAHQNGFLKILILLFFLIQSQQ